MKQAIKINLAGVIFHIDEDGYDRLKKYLDKITIHYGKEAEGKEIIDDIERRIAELFQNKMTGIKEVINIVDVEEIIGVLGEPEEIIGEQETRPEEEFVNVRKNYRRLYRDTEDSIIGGVCSGLAHYFNIDVVWMRLIFIALLFMNGLGFLIYIIMWIAVVSAKTTAQRLEMKGEKVTVSSIEKEYETSKSSSGISRIGRLIGEFFKAIGLLIRIFIKFILIFIGAIFILVGLFVVISLGAALFFKTEIFPFIHHGIPHFPTLILNIAGNENMILLLAALFLMVAIPVAILIYAGIKLIFKFKANDKLIGRTAIGLWIISIILFAGIAIAESRNFRTEKRVYSSEELTGFKGKTLYVKIDQKKDSNFIMNHFYMFDDEYNIYVDEKHNQVYGMPHISIQKSDDSTVSVVLRKKSFGSSPDRARDLAKGLEYTWALKDTVLVFDPYFASPEKKKWLFPNLEIVIKIPVGKEVFLTTSLEDYLSDTENNENLSERDMVSKKWIMKRNGLSLAEDE